MKRQIRINVRAIALSSALAKIDPPLLAKTDPGRHEAARVRAVPLLSKWIGRDSF